MKKSKLLVSIMIVILIFFSFTNVGYADTEERSEQIEETIDDDEGGLFEKVIAKIIRWASSSSI